MSAWTGTIPRQMQAYPLATGRANPNTHSLKCKPKWDTRATERRTETFISRPSRAIKRLRYAIAAKLRKLLVGIRLSTGAATASKRVHTSVCGF
jgi:hypothetical protein